MWLIKCIADLVLLGYYMVILMPTFLFMGQVVVRGLRARRPIIPSPMHMDKLEWWTRGVQPTSPLEAKDPSIDGALCSQLHEWRFNMVTGQP